MPDWILNLGVTGQQQVASEVKKVTNELNEQKRIADLQRKQEESIGRFRKAQADLARLERKEAFDRLSTTEKLVRLEAQRERIQERITRAQGNQYRTAALTLRLAQTQAQIRQFSGGGGPGFMGAAGAFGGAFGGRMLGMLGGGVAGSWGGPIGIAIGSMLGTMLAGGISGGVRGAFGVMGESDSLSDIAEQIGVSRTDLLKLRRASGVAGVRENTSVRGLSRLGQMRAAALGGDQKAMALFRQYGVSEEQLRGSQTTMQLGQTIRGSLGRAGALSTDATQMQELFGQRWQQVLAVFTTMSGMANDTGQATEASMKKLDEANAKIEAFKNKLKDFATNATAKFIDLFETIFKNPAFWRVLTTMASFLPGASAAVAGWASWATSNTPNQPNLPANRTAPVTTPALGQPSAVPENPTLWQHPGLTRSSDALARVGLFRGSGDSLRPTVEQINRKVSTMVRELQTLNHNVTAE